MRPLLLRVYRFWCVIFGILKGLGGGHPPTPPAYPCFESLSLSSFEYVMKQMDRYIGQRLKKWAFNAPPPLDGKQRLIQKAAALPGVSQYYNTPASISLFQFFQAHGYLECYPSQDYSILFLSITQLPTRLLGLRL